MKSLQQNTPKNNRKRIIIFSTILVLLFGAGIYYIWQQNNADSPNADSSKTHKDSDKPSTDSQDDSKNPEDQSDTTSQPNSPPSASTDNSSVATPSITEPSVDTAYPIENSHYRIQQTSAKHFDITLYPISGSEYNSQLKQYKQEALDYLRKRHGDISTFSIQWTPSSAENL